MGTILLDSTHDESRVKWRSSPCPKERKAAATVRRPEVSRVPYTRVRIWRKVGRVNTSANGWSKRSDSGERDICPPPEKNGCRLIAISKRSSLFILQRFGVVIHAS